MTDIILPEILRLIEAREDSSVLKMRLLGVSSSFPDTAIIAFEGDDDKVVFSAWIYRVRHDLGFEPFVCNGKREARKLSRILCSDRGDLRTLVHIFVDRDFDDLRDFCLDAPIFMTDRYSIESYLADPDTFRLVLRDFFPLDGNDETKATILNTFCTRMDEFLTASSEINERMFLASRLRIRRKAKFSIKLSHIATVDYDRVTKIETDWLTVAPLDEEPKSDNLKILLIEFSDLDRFHHYRGKFILAFTKVFLGIVAKKCRDGCPVVFGGVARGNVREGEYALSGLAMRSPLPIGFSDYINAI